MPANQLLLTGVSAFVGQVLGPTRVKFFIEQNEFDPAKAIEVDLARNPENVAPGAWATDVEVDQQTGEGLTTIGPRFHAGLHRGGVYLAERIVSRYASVLAGWPPSPDVRYQYQAVLREENGVRSRYHGFKVRVMSSGAGTLAHLGFFRAADTSNQPARIQWIDLGDPAISDPASNGFTTITPSAPAGTEGALFLSMAAIASGSGTDLSKYPRGLGW